MKLVTSFQDECDKKEGVFHRKSDQSPPPEVKLAAWTTTTKEEQADEDTNTELVEVGAEDEAPEKAEIPREDGDIPGHAGSSQIEVLGQLFPGRSRGSLETALRESGGDLVKALEKCARFVDMNMLRHVSLQKCQEVRWGKKVGILLHLSQTEFVFYFCVLQQPDSSQCLTHIY